MDNLITYDKMFNILNVNDIVIFEDMFSLKSTKNEVCYGLVRMAVNNRNIMFEEIEAIDATAKEQMYSFAMEFEKVFDAINDWENEVPYNDIETAFGIIKNVPEHGEQMQVIAEKYRSIDIDGWEQKEKLLSVLASYGVGVEISNWYEELFSEYIQREARWKCFRIYRDFTASTESDFRKYIENALQNHGMIVCIVDDQLRNGQKCAVEVSKCIEKIQSGPNGRMKIIGLIYSSFPNGDCISDKIYFEYIEKDASKREFQAALTKSSYSQMLSELKGVYQRVLGGAFDEALKSKNIAYYLSNMAECEGVTNYQVITNWIKLLLEYRLDGAPELVNVAAMTRLINLLEDEKVNFSKEMLELNTFEAFDFGVNKYREPIASGDIFISGKDIFILVGQDCDLMNSSTRTRKNGISELVTASAVNQPTIDNPVKLNNQYMFISNFRKSKDDTVKTLKIRYVSREFIENPILQMCQFNDEGRCNLDINVREYRTIGIEPTYYENMYKELVLYFEALGKISKQDKEALEIIMRNEQSKRVISLTDYNDEQAANGIFEYKIRRICRLRHPYMLYLYKMYLEHQGRHPFDCMNMSRVQEIQVKLLQDERILITVDAVLTPDRELNRSNIESMDWYIDANILENVISRILGLPVEISGVGQCIEVKKEATTFECILENGSKKQMKLLKVSDLLSIEECQ